jgi:hypothetical protein
VSTLRTFAREPLYSRAAESAHGMHAESNGDDVVKLDCYGVLGLSPTAEDVVIRAAYLALMRSYHPDKNGSREAAARARAITEAYKTIGDPARRAEYDASRRAYHYEILGYDDEPAPLRPWKLPQIQFPKAPAIRWPKLPAIQLPTASTIVSPNARLIGAVAASALAIVLAATMLPLTQTRPTDNVPSGPTNAAPGTAATTPEPAISSRATEKKHSSEEVASVSSEPMEGSAAPAPTAVRPAEVEPARAPEAARAIATPVPAKADVPPKPMHIAASMTPTVTRPAAPKPSPVDERARVASLERMSTSFYNQSVTVADDTKRLQLQQARDQFASSRNACQSDSCVGDAHASYIRDISRIMQKPKQPTP